MTKVLKQRCKVSFEEIKKLPIQPGVYFLFQKGLLVYIGKARILQTRITQHIQTKNFDEIEYEIVHWSRSRELEGKLLKSYYIQHKQYPLYNYQG